MPHVRPEQLLVARVGAGAAGDARGGYARIREGHEQAVPFGLRALMREGTPMAPKRSRKNGWPAARRELDEAMHAARPIGEQLQYLMQLLLVDAQIADGLGEPQGLAGVDSAGRCRSARPGGAVARAARALGDMRAARCERQGLRGARSRPDQLTEGVDTPQVARARELLKGH